MTLPDLPVATTDPPGDLPTRAWQLAGAPGKKGRASSDAAGPSGSGDDVDGGGAGGGNSGRDDGDDDDDDDDALDDETPNGGDDYDEALASARTTLNFDG